MLGKAQMGVQYDKYQQVIQENAKLMKKLREIQEQLAITSAKKEAFRAQAGEAEGGVGTAGAAAGKGVQEGARSVRDHAEGPPRGARPRCRPF